MECDVTSTYKRPVTTSVYVCYHQRRMLCRKVEFAGDNVTPTEAFRLHFRSREPATGNTSVVVHTSSVYLCFVAETHKILLDPTPKFQTLLKIYTRMNIMCIKVYTRNMGVNVHCALVGDGGDIILSAPETG